MADPLENKDSLAERFGSRSPRHGESAKPFESALDVANRALFTYPLEPLFPNENPRIPSPPTLGLWQRL
jgi:hypothetical protein